MAYKRANLRATKLTNDDSTSHSYLQVHAIALQGFGFMDAIAVFAGRDFSSQPIRLVWLWTVYA
jgi:hypothetical protein